MENCKRLYADTLAFYRRELSGPVFTAGWAFAGIVVLSFAFSLLSPTRADAVIAYYAQMLGQSGVADEGGNIQFFALLMNNLVAMTLSLVYGLIPFLRLPALTLGTNGAILGLTLGTLVMTVIGTAFNAVYLLPKFAQLYGIPMEVLIGMGTAVHSGVTGVFSFVALCVAPLNLVKGAVVSLLTMLLYKRVAGPLFRIHE